MVHGACQFIGATAILTVGISSHPSGTHAGKPDFPAHRAAVVDVHFQEHCCSTSIIAFPIMYGIAGTTALPNAFNRLLPAQRSSTFTTIHPILQAPIKTRINSVIIQTVFMLFVVVPVFSWN
jgi:hypothetical protein